MDKPKNIFTMLIFIMLIVYLFVTAPAPLQTDLAGRKVETKKVLEIINAINSQVRNLYTKNIVGAGKKSGLRFNEDWQEEDVFAGPLPAQFLRETSRSLEKNNVQLGLYLGSDYPINTANLFSGKQRDFFKQLKTTGEPKFFYVEDIERYGYMFADKAIAKPCVSCHNKHDDSPKKDWRIDDIMGATTWTYPDEFITLEIALELISALRSSVNNAYAAYIDKIKQFKNPPALSSRWPKEGFYLPSVAHFMEEVDRRIAVETMQSLLLVASHEEKVKTSSGE